jgi:hypothetical protein
LITENLSTLKIHKLTQEQYDRELEAGRVDENALYLTPYEETDLSDYATKEYVNNKITENSGSSESSNLFVVTIDYEHNTASHSASEIEVAYESGKIVVTMDEFGTLIPLYWVDENEAIFHYIDVGGMIYSMIIIVDEDKQVTLNNKEYSIEVPHFDFASMGMSPIPMPAGTVTFVHDMTDIIESLEKGAVSVRIPCSSGGTTIFYFDCHVMGHKKVGADCVQVSVPAFLFNQAGESIANFLVTAIIYADRAVINVEPFNASGVSNSDVLVVQIDFNTNIASHSPAEIKSACNEGKVVITADRGHLLVPLYNAGNTTAVFKAVYYTAAKTLMEETYTISQNRSVTETSQIILDNENGTGGGGYTPVRGVDYWTDEDKAEIKSYVDEAILGGAW